MHALSSIPISLPFPNPNPNSTLNPSFLDSTTTMPSHTQTPSPEENRSSPSPATLNRVSFNQDRACFAAATDSGFRVLACDPFREPFCREFAGGGIGMAEMHFQSSVIALVGGGASRPQFPPNKVVIWDDHRGRCFGEVSFRAAVRGLQLGHDRIFVALEMKVFMYNFADLKLLHQVETIANPKGLCAVSQVADSVVMACPGLRRGQVRVEHYLQKRTCFVSAHESSMVSLALTLDGKFLATASAKGTLIRVFNSANGALLRELRRGANTAEIYSLAFSSSAQWLACSSDKGTVHVFGLKVNSGIVEHEKSQSSSNSDTASTSNSSLSFIRSKVAGVLPKYFSSEWSLAQFRLKEGSHYTVAFGHQKNTIIILGMDGSFYRCQFDPGNGGEMTQLEYHNFLKPESDS